MSKITFAETPSLSNGTYNTAKPPLSVMDKGFADGQPAVHEWFNWLFSKIFDKINRDVVTDGNGQKLFTLPNSFITLNAVNVDNPSEYIIASGFKGESTSIHSLNVISSNVLTLGVPTASGDQPVLGAANIKILGMSRD